MTRIVEPVYRKIGKRMRKFREHSGMTQLDVAVRSRTSRAHIANMERGEERIRIHTLANVAKALGVHLGWFFD